MKRVNIISGTTYSNIFLEYFHEALNNLFDEHTLFLYELMCVRYF